MTAGVVPQSSWSLSPQAPGLDLLDEAASPGCVPLAEDADVDRQPLDGLEHPLMFQGPGVQVVAHVPVAEPVPPPISVVTPEAIATSICCGQMKWMWVSMPPAVTIFPSPAMISVPGTDDDGDAGLGRDCRTCRWPRSGRP